VASLPKILSQRYWLQLSLVIVAITLQGCAVPVGQVVYNGVSAVSIATTGKGVPELGASHATGADCSVLNYLFKDRDYVCEQPRETATTYNRNVF
jgi:hypothetical protein